VETHLPTPKNGRALTPSEASPAVPPAKTAAPPEPKAVPEPKAMPAVPAGVPAPKTPPQWKWPGLALGWGVGEKKLG